MSLENPVALFDIDKTMTNGLSFFPIADYQKDEGLISPDYHEELYHILERYRGNEIEYEDLVHQLNSTHAMSLAGLPRSDVQESVDAYFRMPDSMYGYVRPTVDTLRPTHTLALVTGASQFTANAVAEQLHIPHQRSTIYEVVEGALTGVLLSELATRDEKKAAVTQLMAGTRQEGSLGFGDSVGDLEMLRAVSVAICIDPSDELRAQAIASGWVVYDDPDVLNAPEPLPLFS